MFRNLRTWLFAPSHARTYLDLIFHWASVERCSTVVYTCPSACDSVRRLIRTTNTAGEAYLFAWDIWDALPNFIIRVTKEISCYKLLKNGLRDVVNHLMNNVIVGTEPILGFYTHFWSVVQHIDVHSLIRQNPDALTAEVCQEIDPISIFTRRAQFAHLICVKTKLPANFEASRAQSVCLRCR